MARPRDDRVRRSLFASSARSCTLVHADRGSRSNRWLKLDRRQLSLPNFRDGQPDDPDLQTRRYIVADMARSAALSSLASLPPA
jgi:hypothetical protein